MILADLALADSVWPEQLAALVDLELRSRDAAPFAHSAAVADFEAASRAVDAEQLATVEQVAKRIALRLWPDEARELMARSILVRVALMDLVPAAAETRMYLGRAWRKWREGLASS